MVLLPALAKKIIDEVKKLFDEDIIIVDVDGMIIASTDPSRINSFHEGALICMREKRNVIISKADEGTLRGVKAGINLPVISLHEVIGVIGITGEPERILPYGEILRKMTELLIQESYYTEQVQSQTRMTEAFVFDWLQLKEWELPFLERAHLLNIDLQKKRQAVLIHLGELKDSLRRDLWQFRQLWRGAEEQDVLIHWGNDRLLFLFCVPDSYNNRFLKEKLREMKRFIEESWKTRVSIGAGQEVRGAELKKSYEQAERALTVALRDQIIVFEEELKLDICLGDISPSIRNEFTRRVLENIQDNQELLDTIRTYFHENMSLKAAAESLNLHVNTLHYRISKLKELTGIDLKNTQDIISLYLALYFLDNHLKIN